VDTAWNVSSLTREEDLSARGIGPPTMNHNSSQDGDVTVYSHMQLSTADIYREGLRVLAQSLRLFKFFHSSNTYLRDGYVTLYTVFNFEPPH
jgi:hypothetical protein